MATQDLQIYCERWRALDTLIAGLTETYSRQEFPRKNTILYLLKSLQEFARGQLQFFYYGLDHDNLERLKHDPILELSDKFPAEDVLTGIIEQIGHDLELIQRAADQRISGDDHVRKTLAKADKLAWSAVKPAIDYAVIEEATTVLTYFQKSAEFYRIPYAQVALIAIPYTCTATNDPRDYLAIPHEVGHYVFRHKTGIAQEDFQNILPSVQSDPQAYQPFQDWLKAIFEELFADIYGCLIAGPVMALDLQDVSLANSLTDFRDGDGEHPNAALRPLIYCQVLANLSDKELTAGNWRPVAEKLSALWEERLNQRGVTEIVLKTSPQAGQGHGSTAKTLSIAEVIGDVTSTKAEPHHGPLGEVVDKIVETISDRIRGYAEKYRPTQYKHNLRGWAGPITAETEVDNLYPKYKDNFTNLLAEVKLMPPESDPSSVPVSAGDPDAHTSQLWLDWIRGSSPKFKGEWPPKTTIKIGDVKKPDNLNDLEDPNEVTWASILYADGWTTSGPGPDPGHPFSS